MTEDTEEKSNVPNLEIDAKNRVIEQTKDIPLQVNGKEVLITIRKLNTGVRNRIRSECTKTTMIAGQPVVKVDDSEIQEKILSKAIVSAPFEISVEAIKGLPSDVSDYLFYEYSEFAEPSDKKKVSLEEA